MSEGIGLVLAEAEARGRFESEIARRPGAEELHPERSRLRWRILTIVLGVGVPAVLITLWQLASSRGWIDRRLYPAPSDVITAARDLHRDGRLWDNTFITGKRTVYGYVIGAGLGVVAGFAMGMSRILRAALEPMLNALYVVPKLALLPVFLTIFKFGEGAKYALIATTVFFFTWISTLTAVVAVPAGYRDTAKSLRVKQREMFWHVLLPGALPQVFVGMRIAAGVAVLMVVGVEFTIGNDGLGFLIEQGRSLVILRQTYVGIVIVALLGVLFTMIIGAIGRVLCPWAESSKHAGRI